MTLEKLLQRQDVPEDVKEEIRRNITERKKTKMTLQQSEKSLNEILNNLDGLVYVADMKTYEVLFVNKYGKTIWGDFMGKTCWQNLQLEQKGPCSFCTNDRLLHPDGTSNGVYIWEFQNTITKKWYECRDSAIHWPDGRIVRMEIATDITERKQFEKALIEKESLSVIGELTSGMAHDFNNSLYVILGNLENALHETDPILIKDYINISKKFSLESASIIKQLQHFVGKNNIQIDYESINLNVLLDDLIEQTRFKWKDEIEKSGLEIIINRKYK